MKDILKKYKKHKKFTNISIIVTSLILAVSINIFIINGSDFGNSMKASVLDAKTQANLSDIYAKNNENTIQILSSKNMNNVKNISLSFSYNPENIEIISYNSNNAEIIEISSQKGLNTLLLNYSPEKNISKNNILFSITAKKQTKSSEQINIFNANFTDSTNQTYLLSTSGITF